MPGVEIKSGLFPEMETALLAGIRPSEWYDMERWERATVVAVQRTRNRINYTVREHRQ